MLIQPHEALEALDGVHKLIDWSRLEPHLPGLYNPGQGEQAWPPLLRVKGLVLQSWSGLSDPKTEKQLARDLRCRRFVNLSLSEGVPGHSPSWRFRHVLDKQPLLAEVNRPLPAPGLFIKTGELSRVEATVIDARQSRPRQKAQAENPPDREAG